METYTVRVAKDYLGFAAAHFIVFDNDQCERLHGHNYRVAAELEDGLRPDWLVFDFIELKKILKGVCDELDHRMLVPLHSDTLDIDVDGERVRITPRKGHPATTRKEWIIPLADCVLLPIENTTAELLARWFVHRLRDELIAKDGRSPSVVRIEVYESPGQSARFELRAADESLTTSAGLSASETR